jgi:hypothetical protein
MTAFHLSSRISYTRDVALSVTRIRFTRGGGKERWDGVRGGVDAAEGFVDGGDQANLEFLKSWLWGSAMLLTISKEVRLRICRRAPERQAMCDAVGDGTESDVARMFSNDRVVSQTLTYF